MFKNILLTSSLALLFLTGCSTKEDVLVSEKDKYGVLSKNGEVIIKPIYDELSSFDDVNNKNIKTEHPHLINLHWLHNYYGEEYAIAEYRGKYGIVDKENKMVVKPIYDSITKLFNGFSIIKLDNKYGYMNDKFEVVQKPIFKKAREFEGNVTFVQSTANNKWSCLTKDMDLKIDDEYDEIYSLYNEYSRTVKDGKWGFIKNNCEVLIEPKYEYASDFSNGLAKVIKNGKVTYVNTKGEEITENAFTNGENF